jgi:hypothetical protein
MVEETCCYQGQPGLLLRKFQMPSQSCRRVVMGLSFMQMALFSEGSAQCARRCEYVEYFYENICRGRQRYSKNVTALKVIALGLFLEHKFKKR